MPPEPPSPTPLPVENISTACFKCVFPACGGICCRNGRPTVEEAEQMRISGNLDKILPLLRPSARAHIGKAGWLTNRVKGGLRTVAVEGGWCVFENGGCSLQKAGMLEDEPWKYKPAACIRFPLDKDGDDVWYVRQWGHRDEQWDLFCLNPKANPTPASESLRDEIAFVAAREKNPGEQPGTSA